ncbi:MAG TPA: hypothetical protein VMQ93_16075 [Novosphingobium sp.]|nr:hypothetical protein [Novosphingobium sp.]
MELRARIAETVGRNAMALAALLLACAWTQIAAQLLHRPLSPWFTVPLGLACMAAVLAEGLRNLSAKPDEGAARRSGASLPWRVLAALAFGSYVLVAWMWWTERTGPGSTEWMPLIACFCMLGFSRSSEAGGA